MITRFPSTWIVPHALVLLSLAASAGAAHAMDAKSLAGYWRGEVGNERERVAVGLDLQPDSNGGLEVKLDLPVVHFERMRIDGSAHVEGGRLVLPQLQMALRLEDGRLSGPLMSEGETATLERGAPLSANATAAASAAPALPGPHWSTRLNGQIFASPQVSDGIAYIGTTGGSFNAVDTDDGSLLWAVSLGYPIYAAARIGGDAIYVASDGGFLHCLERVTGKERWRVALDGGRGTRLQPHPSVYDWDWQAPQPLLAGDTVYAGGADGVFHALDAATGKRHWTVAVEGRIRQGAAVDAERVYVASEAGVVHALDRRDGNERWRYSLGGQNGSALAVHDGLVYANARNATLHAIHAVEGTRAWSVNFWGSWVESAPTFADGTLYIGSSDMRRVSAIEPTSGRVLWRTDVFGQTWGTPLVLGERLVVGAAAASPYFLHHEAGLAILDRRSGALLGRWTMPEGTGHQWGIAGDVVRSGDTLVAAGIEGNLMGFAFPQ